MVAYDGAVQPLGLDVRHELINALQGQLVHIPDLQKLFHTWPKATNPHLAALHTDVDQILNSLFPPGKRLSKLRAADPGLFAGMWWPYSSLERLCVANCLSLWLFAWDDEIDSREFSDLAANFEDAQAFRKTTLNRVRMHLNLDQNGTDQAVDAAASACHDSILELFAPVGRAMVSHCTLVNKEQREAMMQQIELFVSMVEVEHRAQLSGYLESVKSYQFRRMGTSGVGVCLAIHEYALNLRLPPDILNSTMMQSLRDQTNLIISVSNDILSVKKEIEQKQVDSLIPLLAVARGYDAQAAVDDATRILEEAVMRFDMAATALLECYAGDAAVSTDLVAFIDSCRFACTGNLNWSLGSGRYRLHVESLRGGITVKI